jgi:adenylylsulfate kinase-like enzyme
MISEDKQNIGGLIWITGYSGAGKTTVARLVNEKLKEKNMPVVLLDGDEIRSILGERYGHELDERRQLGYVYGRLCKKISDCDITVVIATVAMFEAVRLENRASNIRYSWFLSGFPFYGCTHPIDLNGQINNAYPCHKKTLTEVVDTT